MSIQNFINDEVRNNKTVLNSLYKRPHRELGVDAPHFQILKPNVLQQADILYVPEDKTGYKFILVIADVNNKKIDAVPIKDLKQEKGEVFEGIKTIYSRRILKMPQTLSFDGGNEFKGANLLKYLKENHINVKVSEAGRHRSRGTVEQANAKLGAVIHKLQANQELLTGVIKKDWAEDLKDLVKFFNEHRPPPITNNNNNEVLSTDYSGNMLKMGTEVRTLLNHPINTYNGGSLPGKFRKSDIRWSTDIEPITNVLITPNMPIMYNVDDNENIAYTKQQLQVVTGKLRDPNPEYIRGDTDTYIIEKIVDKKIENKKHLYLVKKYGYDATHNIWEHSSTFDRTEDLKKMKRDYNSTL